MRMRYIAGVSEDQMRDARERRATVVRRIPGGGNHVQDEPLPAARIIGALLLISGALFIALTSRNSGLKQEQVFKPLEEVRWGIIGCGDVTEVKSGPALSLIPQSRLVAVMRRNASMAKDYAERHNVPSWTSDAEELIDNPDVSAVYIATPPRYHAEYALMAAQAGKPAYVEKPFGRSYLDGSEMVDAFEREGLPLFVAYYRRALPNFAQIKQLLEGGAIGQVLSVHVQYHRPPNKKDLEWGKVAAAAAASEGGMREDSLRRLVGASLSNSTLSWRPDPAVGGVGGYFRDKGSHQLDLLEYWFGPIVSVSGSSSNRAGLYPSPDTLSAVFSFSSGVLGTGSWCFVASKAGQEEYGEIAGTKGRIRFQFFLSSKITLLSEESGKSKEWEVPMPKHVQQPLLETVVRELTGVPSGEPTGSGGGGAAAAVGCPSTGESALRTSFIVDKIVAGSSWQQGSRH